MTTIVRNNVTTHSRAGMFLLAACLLTAPVFRAVADNVTWTNSAGDLLWSTAANWTPNQVPTSADDVTFDTTAGGPTNVQGAVNNVVSASIDFGILAYSPVSPGFHTTLLLPGVTVWSNTNTVSANASPNMNKVTAAGDVGYATIIGTNASLICGNTTSPVLGNWVEVWYAGTIAGTQRATLDMSGLDNFTFRGGVVRIGASSSGQTSQAAARGTLILAKTNFIIAAQAPGATPAAGLNGGFMVGASPRNTAVAASGDQGDVQLGRMNTLWADYVKVGGYHSATGTMSFQASALAFNPALTLRGVNGTDRVLRVGIGDSGEMTRNVNLTAGGTVDLTGGTVDALVSDLFVGRSTQGGTATRGNANGKLTFTAGTVDATTLSIGSQGADNQGSATGVVNVRSNASLIVDTLNIGGDQGTAVGTANGTLNIAYGGRVTVTNNVVENSSGADGSSTINITNGTLTVGGTITVDTINLNRGTVSNATTITPAVKGNGTLANVGSFAGALIPGDLATPGSLTNLGALNLSGTATLNFSLTNVTTTGSGVNDYAYVSGDINTSGDMIVIVPTILPLAIGTYRLVDYTGAKTGSFTVTPIRNTALDQSTANQINLVVSGFPSNLVWTGSASADWDVALNSNWTNTSGGAEIFYQYDTVTFNDTAIQTGVNLVGTLYPAALAVSGANNYTFSGAGQIVGNTGLTKSGTGTLTVGNVNSFVGNVNVNGGALIVDGALGSAPISVNSSGTLGGSGTIGGPVTVQSGGTFSPGSSIGTLTINNSLVLSAGSTNAFEVDTDTLACDVVAGLSSVTYGGTLVISPSGGGTALTNGASVKLFTATSYSGSFAAIVPATPVTGMVWDTSQLTVSGTLRMVTRPNLTSSVTANALDISWPSDHTGWRLQGQTNTVSVGLSNNWFTVTGSTTTNHMIMTVNPANGAVFYRLVYP